MRTIKQRLTEAQITAEKDYKTLGKIVFWVHTFYPEPIGMIMSESREQKYIIPRQMAHYLARLQTDLPLREIGGYFGKRNHATVIHSRRSIECMMKTNYKNVRDIYELIDKEL